VLGSCELVAFVGTADPARARRFYEGTLRLPLVDASAFADTFASPGATLRVTAVERVQPAPYTVVGWGVPDIAQAIRELAGRGVEFLRYPDMEQDDLGVWRSPTGARVAWFRDPDGNVLSLTER